MTINWRPLTEHPTDRWERNPAISNLKLVLYRSDGETKIGWANYSHCGEQWIILSLYYDIIAWADISEEEFLNQVETEIGK